MKNRHKRNVNPTLNIRVLNFFSVMFSSHCCHLFISNMRYSAAPHRISKCLVTFSYTHVHVVVFGQQFCGFVYLNVYY